MLYRLRYGCVLVDSDSNGKFIRQIANDVAPLSFSTTLTVLH